jgi:hypothetical protein
VKSKILPSADSSASPLLFQTQNTNLCAFLLACGLHYNGAQMARDLDAVEFALDDPDGLCPQLVSNYKTGKASTIAPRALFESLRFLKNEVRRVRGVANAKPR